MKLKTEKLAVRCYARHGDTCGLGEHHDALGCATRLQADDYVLVAEFAYLQEGNEYCHETAKRGVNMHLVSRIVPTAPFHVSFSAEFGGVKIAGPDVPEEVMA